MPPAPAQPHRFPWPDAGDLLHVLTLQDYNTRLVVLSTALLGLAAGLVGSFLLLRRRSLMGDALSHATLPGIALAFMVMVAFGGSGKSLPGLLLGAVLTGLLGVGCVLLIQRLTRLKDDAAMGIVLSVFFGAGVALLGIIQNMPTGNQAGLESFIYGKTASMVQSDFRMIALAAIASTTLCLALYKELKLLCFDEGFARSQGWPTLLLDLVMLTLVTAVTVIGLQAVGLILILALLIIPPAAARFWTDRLWRMMLLAAVIGAASGWLGATFSALMPRMPAGAVIVVVAAGFFVLSLLTGPRRGLLPRLFRQSSLQRQITRQHLLRALYEAGEAAPGALPPHHAAPPAGGLPSVSPPEASPLPRQALLRRRSWTPRQLKRSLRAARRAGLVTFPTPQTVALSPLGLTEARRVVRNHRLWELYLITHAQIAPSQVDRGADLIEHVLGTELVQELEQLLTPRPCPVGTPPPSPHALTAADPE